MKSIHNAAHKLKYDYEWPAAILYLSTAYVLAMIYS